ncbi:diaminobutyrate--2-oxoglutarate transaminase family protein [Fangia hongkongensis]|uniref:diaminobutyrate--2-oxoglutarate transaminase family protein n=1 Tax=Fangia hongkongensis TaxID=270495 RepID=UPI0003774224|nr:diaminobutyrate--2-oxoglutarate transaminase family protein [Fangia hongkongensis]
MEDTKPRNDLTDSISAKADMMKLLLGDQASWESNARSYPRKNPFVIDKAKGIYLTDITGKKYIDALGGAGSLALGHNHPKVLEAIESVLQKSTPLHTLDLLTYEKHAFMLELLDSLPEAYHGDVKIQFCSPTGADAVEAAIKLCKTATNRENILAFHGAYHGMTHGTLAMMGNIAPKQNLSALMPSVHFLPYPYAYRCPFGLQGDNSIAVNIEMISRMLSDPESGIVKPAAIILEPIQGEGGVIVPPISWLQAIANLAKAHDIPLVVDEVQTGIGRTGYLYAFERANITPDVIVLSKAIGGGLPISVVIYKKKLDLWQPGAHAGTFRGNTLAMAAGLATLKEVRKPEFLAQVRSVGCYFKSKLIELKSKHKLIGDVRGEGLMLGMEVIDYKQKADGIGSFPADGQKAMSIKKLCFQKGLIIELGGRHSATLRFLPPLILTKEDVDKIIQIVDESLKEV